MPDLHRINHGCVRGSCSDTCLDCRKPKDYYLTCCAACQILGMHVCQPKAGYALPLLQGCPCQDHQLEVVASFGARSSCAFLHKREPGPYARHVPYLCLTHRPGPVSSASLGCTAPEELLMAQGIHVDVLDAAP